LIEGDLGTTFLRKNPRRASETFLGFNGHSRVASTMAMDMAKSGGGKGVPARGETMDGDETEAGSALTRTCDHTP
jgi:hypothetical protein